jgi:hypothetical protein
MLPAKARLGGREKAEEEGEESREGGRLICASPTPTLPIWAAENSTPRTITTRSIATIPNGIGR